MALDIVIWSPLCACVFGVTNCSSCCVMLCVFTKSYPRSHSVQIRTRVLCRHNKHFVTSLYWKICMQDTRMTSDNTAFRSSLYRHLFTHSHMTDTCRFSSWPSTDLLIGAGSFFRTWCSRYLHHLWIPKLHCRFRKSISLVRIESRADAISLF
jgi:hypothetical protein